jgi:hemerythrin superfamily protein
VSRRSGAGGRTIKADGVAVVGAHRRVDSRSKQEEADVVSAIEYLRRQHREVEQLFEQLKVSDDDRERVSLLGRLAECITLHTALEERHFYPLCRRLGLDGEAQRSLEDHARVRRLVSELLEVKRKDPRLPKLVEALQEAVESHVEEEETDVFPKVQAGSQDEALDALEDRMAEDHAQLKERGLLSLAEEEQPSAP